MIMTHTRASLLPAGGRPDHDRGLPWWIRGKANLGAPTPL